METHKRGKSNESEPKDDNIVYDEVKLDDLPKFTDLKAQVDEVVARSSWWDLYGVDWAIIVVFLGLFYVSLLMLRSESWLVFGGGAFLCGWFYQSMGVKAGHSSAHGGLTKSKLLHRPLANIFVEFIGTFSEELAYYGHIKEHHPYTNVIGIGDSAVWKVPALPRFVYMFFGPLMLPPVTIIVSIAGLLEKKSFLSVVKYVIVAGAGLCLMTYLLMNVSGLSLSSAVAVMWISRGVFSIPYIHVNIFQHIGLPMFAKEHRPVRIYQMTVGVLNLPRNIILDYAFGHAVVSCHIEHHLFPKLSDNMCLKIQPIVSKFVKESGLPYNEKTYFNRLTLFLDQYEKLMVNAPPITHFVGIQ